MEATKFDSLEETIIVNFKANSIDGQNRSGQIRIEDRSTEYYYCWNIYDENQLRLAAKCLPVSKSIIPNDKDQFDFVLNHAIQGINTYRMLRKKVFQVVQWEILGRS